MLKFTLLAVGDKMPAWVNLGYHDYAKRIQGRARLELLEIPGLKRTKNSDLAKIKTKETELLLAKLPRNNRLVSLDLRGKHVSTPHIAKRMDYWLSQGQNVSFAIGGPEGFEQSVVDNSDEVWKLSDCTYPHPLVRIILAEQLYRAWSILEGSPYHR